jgi:hypothetical protein
MPSPHMDDSGRLVLPKTPSQRVSSGRVAAIQYATLGSAFGLTVLDAYISYDGFTKLSLPEFVPLALATLIFVSQLATGCLQQLGMDPFKGVGGSEALDTVWKGTLIGIYAIDIGSNAISFGAHNYLSWPSLSTAPFDSLAMAMLMIGCAVLLTFGDEILLRLYDRISIGSKKNAIAAKATAIEYKGLKTFLNAQETSVISRAEVAGSNSNMDLSRWGD